MSNPQALKSGKEGIRDKVNLQYNVHKHIDRMSKIINDPNLGEQRYNWAIEHLLAIMEPYGDIAFNKEKKDIEKKYNKKIADVEKTSDEEKLIREKNQRMFRALNFLIKRLRMGLEIEGMEDIGEPNAEETEPADEPDDDD